MREQIEQPTEMIDGLVRHNHTGLPVRSVGRPESSHGEAAAGYQQLQFDAQIEEMRKRKYGVVVEMEELIKRRVVRKIDI